MTRTPQQLRASIPFMLSVGLVIQGTLTPWRPYRGHKVHHSVAIVKFVVVSENVLDKVVLEGNSSPSIEGGRVGGTVKVAGDNLVLSVAQDTF